jgi:hypothetical protein
MPCTTPQHSHLAVAHINTNDSPSHQNKPHFKANVESTEKATFSTNANSCDRVSRLNDLIYRGVYGMVEEKGGIATALGRPTVNPGPPYATPRGNAVRLE